MRYWGGMLTLAVESPMRSLVLLKGTLPGSQLMVWSSSSSSCKRDGSYLNKAYAVVVVVVVVVTVVVVIVIVLVLIVIVVVVIVVIVVVVEW